MEKSENHYQLQVYFGNTFALRSSKSYANAKVHLHFFAQNFANTYDRNIW